ncbi:muscular LMNA-interacting protein isoform X2 [Scyliorhinus canicula]|nr:muscular LMNA-interacting protein isoform X2 [Scyliorhinus canicula]XP_038656380.1 muscular LMNA-interacting protein isoform X2 [Scyliorhinus canicula]
MKSALGNEDRAVSLTPSLQATKQVLVDETAKPLAFTFVPTVRRLPVHIQVIDTTRSPSQPGTQQKPEVSSSMMNEPLHITEEMPPEDVTTMGGIGGGAPRRHTEISQSWSNNKRGYVSAEEAAPLQGIFKAELVFLADSYATDCDCLTRENEAEVNLSAKSLPLLSLPSNPFADYKGSSIRTRMIVDESKAPLLQDAEQKVDGALQEPFFQSSTSSRTPDNLTTQPLTFTIGNGESSPADLRRACSSSLLNKSSLCFPTKTNLEKKSSSLPRATFLTSSETSFLSSSSLPSGLHTKSLSPSASPLTKSKTASPSYPPSPLLSCSDLQSSPAWSSSSLPSSRSTMCSSTCVQSSLHSSRQNMRSPTSQQISRHSLRILNDSSLTSTPTNVTRSAVVSSPPTQLSLLTSILRSGKRPPLPYKSSEPSKLVSSASSLSNIGSQSSRKSQIPTTPQPSSSCQKARMLSSTPGKFLLDSSGIRGGISSASSGSLASPLSPEPGKRSVHSSFQSLSQRRGNISTETAQIPSGTSSGKHNADGLSPGNSTAAPTSMRHGSKLLPSPHCPSPRHGLLSPSTAQFSSHRFSPINSFSPTQEPVPPLTSPTLDHLPSERASKISPSPHYLSLNYCPAKLDSLSLTPTSPRLSPSARLYNISPSSEHYVSSSTTPTSSSPTPVNSSPQSGSITPTPLNVSSLFSPQRSISISPAPNQVTSHSSSHSPTPTYSTPLRPLSPGQLPCHLSPSLRSNASVVNPARSAAHSSNPRLDITSPGPAQSPPLPTHFSRSDAQSPAQSLSCSTENVTKKPEQKYKIKSSYKAFAAIPTNTLLLEQKAIDEAISDSEESAAANMPEKTHSQFLFESESLRQQSEELYATIEQLLEEPLPMRCSSSTPNSLRKPQDSKAYKKNDRPEHFTNSDKLTTVEVQKHVSPTPKSAGRETKYANLHLSVSESTENRPTRPGVIRPVAMAQKPTAVPKVDESCHNPFQQCPEADSDTEIKECLFPLSTILTSVSYPSLCHETNQTLLCYQDMSQSIPLSLSPVTCLTFGSHIRFSPIAPCNYYMTSNLSRSLHSLYIKPRHSITTIHENEALGINELTDLTGALNRDQHQSQKESERSLLPNTDSNQEALEILEEELEQAVKTSITKV